MTNLQMVPGVGKITVIDGSVFVFKVKTVGGRTITGLGFIYTTTRLLGKNIFWDLKLATNSLLN